MTDNGQAGALLEGIRSALSITWIDPVTDNQLMGITARGISYLDGIAGAPQDYALEGKARELLINYCLYARSGALDQFTASYLADLTYFQLSEEVSRYLARQESDTSLP
jgi:hypothetical protein